jgi:hypothetical protein
MQSVDFFNGSLRLFFCIINERLQNLVAERFPSDARKLLNVK